jgi:hypothetical protein
MRDYRVLMMRADATQRPLISGQRGQLRAISLIRPLTQRLIHPIAVAPHHLEGRVDDLTRASAGEQSPDAKGAK